jgi:uncharacterized damage-inducible protein DinB
MCTRVDGQLARTPAWQIVLHVVNHATLHRGQVMGMLRQILWKLKSGGRE